MSPENGFELAASSTKGKAFLGRRERNREVLLANTRVGYGKVAFLRGWLGSLPGLQVVPRVAPDPLV